MNIKQTILIFALLVGFNGILLGQTVAAAECATVPTSIIGCKQTGGEGAELTNTGIWGILLLIINIMSAGIGVVAVGGLVYGSILYASAGGGPEQIKKAKTIIVDIVIGLVAYAFMFAFLNFIIPGGIFTL